MINIFKNIALISLFLSTLLFCNEIDITIGTKNRMPTFKQVIENLNSADNATDLCLYIMDGNDHNQVKTFLNKKKWNFKLIKIWKDSQVDIIKNNPGKWSIIYDFLIKQGKSPFVTYWSDDILLNSKNIFSKAVTRLNEDIQAGVAIFNFQLNQNQKFGIVLNDIGLISINFGIIKRDAYIKAKGLDSNFKFFRADNDLTNKIYLHAKYKTIINNDCRILCLGSQWKNPYAQKDSYKEDMETFKIKWDKLILKKRVLRKNSISAIYPLNSQMSYI